MISVNRYWRSAFAFIAVVAMSFGLGVGVGQPAIAGSTSGTGCIAHRPAYIEDVFEAQYASGCSGHDEPELDPVSDHAHSGINQTWRVVLPSDGAYEVAQPGPIMWIGGTVHDPNSLFHQSFLEVQFYPDTIAQNCASTGSITGKFAKDVYSVCTPVWSLKRTGTVNPSYHEPAHFNELLRSSNGSTLLMHAGDTVSVHLFVTSASDGWHISIEDLTSGVSGTIVLNSPKWGPLMPEYDRQVIGNSLKWGAVHDTPTSLVWEIGHQPLYASPPFNFCVPGEVDCWSYDATAWAGIQPGGLVSVTFGDGSAPQHWAVVSDYGGKDEVETYCGDYGGDWCIYPWYSRATNGTWQFGVDYPATAEDFGRASQYNQKTSCGGPFGPNSTYCANVIV
jgi:hypothetical protein